LATSDLCPEHLCQRFHLEADREIDAIGRQHAAAHKGTAFKHVDDQIAILSIHAKMLSHYQISKTNRIHQTQ
jgi:hypothetical protein